MVSYAGRRVLVTGATGFIGGRLAERLAFEHGALVRALVHDWRRAVWISRSGAELIEGDVSREETLRAAVDGCDVIFHCVGVGGSPEQCWAVNVDGTTNLLRAAETGGVGSIVYLSSVAVHGPVLPSRVDESTSLVRTGHPYGDSKVAAEEVMTAYVREHRMRTVILRPTYVWGPRSEWYTVEPARMIRRGTWRLVDNGRGSCHAIYVDNLVDAMLLAGQGGPPGVEVYVISDDQPCTWREFYMDYARMIGVQAIPSVSSARTRLRFFRSADTALGGVQTRLEALRPPGVLRLSSRILRSGVRRMRRLLGVSAPIGDWDILKYAQRYELNTSAVRNRLGYRPALARREGMALTEAWLRDQRIIR